MPLEFAILADDLSGANGLGVEFARHGMSSVLIQDVSLAVSIGKDVDVLLIDTDSRYDTGEVSSRKTRAAAHAVQGLAPRCVLKKVDSLLRGPIGYDIDAIMDVYGFDKCLFAAASPKMHRTTVGGYQLVDGIPLLGRQRFVDPTSTVGSSYVPAILAAQSSRSVSCVTTEMIALHGDALAAHLRDARAQILVADAVTQADLSHVVAAAYAAGIRFFAGSYGIGEALHPFGLAHATAAPVLVVAGSTSEMTRRQVARLASETGCTNVVLRFDPGFFQQPVEDFARRFRERLGSGGDIVIHTSGSFEETQQLRAWARDAGWTAAQLSARIEELLQQLVRPLLATCDGFIFSGGATANAIFKLLGASGLTITGREILPATPLAYVNGGSFHGRPYVTKPGSFGDEEDLVAMMNYVKTERHSQAR